MAKKNINYQKNVLHLIKNKFNNYNLGINIELQTGKTPKKDKNIGRRKNNKKDDELKEKIDQFINWYNNERFIKKFNLKTPHELWEAYAKQINWV